MIKLIVSDFDGTLLPYGKKRLSEDIVNRIKDILGKGIKFVVASGRTYNELKGFFGELSDKIYFIANDGALTVKDGKILFGKPFSLAALRGFFERDFFENVCFYSFESVFVLGEFDGQNYGKRIKPIERLFQINEDIYKITATINKEHPSASKDYRVHFRENKFAEFVSPYSNKGVALANLQLHLSIFGYETMAIGDAANDIPMMQHSSYSVSISNKCQELKSKSKYNFRTIEQALDLIEKFKTNIKNNIKQH